MTVDEKKLTTEAASVLPFFAVKALQLLLFTFELNVTAETVHVCKRMCVKDKCRVL